ncbi:sensor histidine kinase [Lutibacter aestuarii]
MYLLIPKFLYNKSYILYLSFLLITVSIGFFTIKIFANTYIDPYRINNGVYIEQSFLEQFYNVSFTMIPFILSSTTLKLFQRWIIDNKKINELENKALKSELKALKNQINPHFLFNMLNNLNVLIKKDPEKASQVTIKLSDFLRHHLYENNKPTVFLQTEIRFINDFLELEKIRRDDFTFEINIKGKIKPTIQIPPNIFTIFVENAVKHSLDTNLPSYIMIDFIIESNNLKFVCINTKSELKKFESKKGLGLKNVKRRLELLYDNRFTLQISDLKATYKIDLKLPL